jgi:hypothetical protein
VLLLFLFAVFLLLLLMIFMHPLIYDCAADDDADASCIAVVVAHVDVSAAAITTHAACTAVGFVI